MYSIPSLTNPWFRVVPTLVSLAPMALFCALCVCGPEEPGGLPLGSIMQVDGASPTGQLGRPTRSRLRAVLDSSFRPRPFMHALSAAIPGRAVPAFGTFAGTRATDTTDPGQGVETSDVEKRPVPPPQSRVGTRDTLGSSAVLGRRCARGEA